MPRYILLHEAASTNTYLKRMANLLPGGTVVYTPKQTAGRGQKGNSWESEPGKNLTFSLLLKRPAVPVASQFYISEAVSVAIAETLSEHTPQPVLIKWPNDIYYTDKKLCGILIENSLDNNGIEYCVIGAGINVNQEVFRSDAPNPVSMLNITGHELDLDALLHRVCERIEQLCDFTGKDHTYFEALHARYMSQLYRKSGLHEWALPTGEHFEAEIAAVEPTGHLTLRGTNGAEHRYAFKEVIHVIGNHEL